MKGFMVSWLVSTSILLGAAGTALAQQSADPAPAPATGAAAPGGAAEGASPAGKLVLLFAPGSAALGAQSEATLDKASRLYREGRPIVMIVAGSSDTTGSPAQNLLLSQARADAVARGMAARGIPAERTQILAKGVTALPVPTGPGVAEPQNRRVEITWR